MRLGSRSLGPRRVMNLPLRIATDSRPVTNRLEWVRQGELDGLLRFGDTRVHVCLPDAMAATPTSPNDFLLLKVPDMIDAMAGIVEDIHPKFVLELGIFKGGSVVLYNEICRPRKLVAIDILPDRLPDLDEYLERTGSANTVSLNFGVDQSDRDRLAALYDKEFGRHRIDLVVDDASHFFFETRESFREFFPRLRPGGVYVIEDWGWSHWSGDTWQAAERGDYFYGRESMTNLVMELVVLSASRPNLVQSVSVTSSAVYVTRGSEDIEPGFDLSAHCLNRGEPLPHFS
ncbi:class I SAM-dependent methyltransferase [Skermania piniformis]|uniref:Class I SAM-dependent methyltransferase n=2 Tax=Skermania pinensis TaxID=39122 RepID=A0ABX8S574_9ACTN|nr:class I SAM-dependent methyltransferase [Skermania piniformis]QXQ12974.1 class I SAM-dependent methyltransferase [Skermania piniformis]